MKHKTTICESTLLIVLAFAVSGCKTFNYTDEDAARERQYFLEHGGYSVGFGGWGGAPSIGGICPSVGNFCPGK